MPDVDAVLLDAGGVFVLPNAALLAAVVRAAGGRSEPHLLDRAHYAAVAALDAMYSPDSHDMGAAAVDAGSADGDDPAGTAAALPMGAPQWMDWSRYVSIVARTCGVPDDRMADAVAGLLELFAMPAPMLWNQVVPEAVVALRALAATDLALAVVSNSDGTVEELLRDAAVCQVGEGAGVPVAFVMDSHHVGSAKPDPAIFVAALERLDVAPGRVVHVGDTAHADVDGALAAGITPLHLDPYGDCPYPSGHHAHVRSLTEALAFVAG